MQIRLQHADVRSLRAGDADSLAEVADNRQVWINLRDAFPHPYTIEHARTFIRAALDERTETRFAIVVDGRAVGAIGYGLHEDVERVSAEIGYWLGEPYWGRGIMTEVVRAVTDYALRTHALTRVYAVPFAWNRASMRVLEKAGYVLEGTMRASAVKDGKVVDQMLYGFHAPRETQVAVGEPWTEAGGWSERLPVVGVMGSGSRSHTERAAPLGRWLAGQSVHLLTGGGGGVMEAVSRAFCEVRHRRGRVLGVVPGVEAGGTVSPPPGYPNVWVEVPIRTHLPLSGLAGAEPLSRNHINVLSADVIVALPGSHGTASEVALALRYGRPLVAWIDEPGQIAGLPDDAPVMGDFERVQAFVCEHVARAADRRRAQSGPR